MKWILSILLLVAGTNIALADTQDYIRANVILVRSDVAYFNVGQRDGVAPGETFEIYYDERMVATGKIAWVDRDIAKTEPLDSSIFVELSTFRPLSAKIRLIVPTASRGGHIDLPIFSEPNLEPAAISTPDDMMIARLIHRGLVTREGSGRIVPDLCGDYEIRDLTYTFYIKPEARFHNGEPVEASDILFSLEQLALASRLTPQSSFVLEIKGAEEFRDRLKNEIAGVFIIDKKTVSITLKRPFPSFEDYLAGPAGYVLPRPGIASNGSGIMGAGSYRVKWRNADGIALEPVADAGDTYLDSLRFLRFGRVDEAGLAFELGRLDIISLLGQAPPKFVSKGNYTSLNGNTDAFVVLGINNLRGLQSDENFGRALSFLLDRGSLVRVILGGSGSMPIYQIPGRPDMSLDLSLPFAPDSAEYYFGRVGKMPSSLMMFVDARFPALTNVARYLAGQLQNIGIKVVDRMVDMQWIEESSARSDLDLYLTCYIPAAGTPDCVFYPLLSESLAGQTNFLYYRDPAFQTFLGDIRAEVNPDKRDNITHGLLQTVVNNPPLVFLYRPHLTTILKTDIAGVVQQPQGFVDLRGAYIETGK
jgi:peptide/nickel transport system substrate-binding protein